MEEVNKNTDKKSIISDDIKRNYKYINKLVDMLIDFIQFVRKHYITNKKLDIMNELKYLI
jgi:hypothetical protein